MATKIIPVSDLRRQTKQIIQTIHESGDVVYVTQHGRPTIVLLGFEAYEALQAQLAASKANPVSYEIGQQSALAMIAEMAEDLGIEDLSENHDTYLYNAGKQIV